MWGKGDHDARTANRGAYYEDTRRLADDLGFPAERADREAVEFATEVLATPQRRLSDPDSRRTHEHQPD